MRVTPRSLGRLDPTDRPDPVDRAVEGDDRGDTASLAGGDEVGLREVEPIVVVDLDRPMGGGRDR